MANQSFITLNDGKRIPQVGLGVWQASPDDTRVAVREALQAGYRHVDTAAIYGNEEGVGLGLKDAGIARDQVFVTSKIWNDAQGYDTASAALDASLRRLDLDYVDLMLIHWPAPKAGRYVDTWKALIDAQKAGKVRSIGVSNFNEDHLQRVIDETGVVPVINQIELHPSLQQRALRDAHARLGIQTESWSPLGQSKALGEPAIVALAQKHRRTPAQIIVRWHVEMGLVVIPKSVTPARIRENFGVFDFTLDQDDLAAIAKLDRGERLGPDPLKFP